MPDNVSAGGNDWFLVTATERAAVEAGTTSKTTIIAQTSRKKKD